MRLIEILLKQFFFFFFVFDYVIIINHVSTRQFKKFQEETTNLDGSVH